jgi:hypothetical protein
VNKTFFASILAVAALGASASERRGMQVLEDGREVEAASLSLPAVAGGALEIRGCTLCTLAPLNLDASTRFFIGQREVSLAELKTHISENPGAAVLIVTPRSAKNQVARIVAQSVGQR